MIIPVLAMVAAAAAPAAPPSPEAQFKDCASLAKSDPNRALSAAGDWQAHGGGIYARQCIGLAYTALERWEPAATAFEQAAREAETAKDPRRADLWVQSGNAWLAADNGTRSRAAFDAALATDALTPALRGEVLLDRARADVTLQDEATARADLDKGLALVPSDPFAWYLSAALALRQKALPRAQQDIAKAVSLAPDDADVLLLAGSIAGVSGEAEAAESFYERAVKAAPNSDAGKSAAAALAANGVSPADKPPPPKLTLDPNP